MIQRMLKPFQLSTGTQLLAICALTMLTGCRQYEHYRWQPLTSNDVNRHLAATLERVKAIQPCSVHAPLLADVEGISIADGVSPDEAAFVSVITNPSLRTLRDQRGVARAQVIQAGILPNPQFTYNADSPTFGTTAGAVNGNAQSLGWDVSKLNPRRSQIRSAILTVDSVNLSIARQEWLIAQQARQTVYGVVALRLQIEKLEQADQVLQSNLKLVEKAVEEGNLTLIELAAATTASATLRTTILANVQLEKQQILLLNRVLGLPADVSVDIQPGVTLPIAGSPPIGEELYPILDYRFDIVAQRRAYEAQDQAYLAAVQAQVPTTVVWNRASIVSWFMPGSELLRMKPCLSWS